MSAPRLATVVPVLCTLARTIPCFKHQAACKPVSEWHSILSRLLKRLLPEAARTAMPAYMPISIGHNAEDAGMRHSGECTSPTGAYATDRTLKQLACQVLAAHLNLRAKPEAGCPPHLLSFSSHHVLLLLVPFLPQPHSGQATLAPLAISSFLARGLKSGPLPSSATPW